LLSLACGAVVCRWVRSLVAVGVNLPIPPAISTRVVGLRRILLFFWAALLLGAPAHAQNNIDARLISEAATVAPGSTVTLAFHMRPKPGWHGYWKNPGDSGMETQVAWDLPAGAEAGPIQYPVPHRLVIAGLMNYVYEGEYGQPLTFKVPADATPGARLPIRGKLDYLACTDEICVPESAQVALDLTVGPATVAGPDEALIDRFRQTLPKPLGSEARFEVAANKLRLAIPVPETLDIGEPYFFPLTDGALAYSAVQSFSRDGDTLIMEVDAGQAGAPAAVEGVLSYGEGQGLSLRATPGSVPAIGKPLAADAASVGAGLLAALGGALLGGLILNLMPCVFPILSLKALSLAKAGGHEGEARREAVAYTAGVVLVCLALGGVLLALRAGGEAAGWAFQLQDPRVILFLLLLVTGIALNLAGLFELPAITGGDQLAAKGGAGGAFWTGALAAFIATPCTGPFMGVALASALMLPWPAALAVFAGLGLGLALPFLLLGFVPALRRLLPKPGAWMSTLRHILSVPMFLTALGLAWILGRQAGVDGMTVGLLAALVLGLALWWVGRRQGTGRAWLPLAPAAAAALAALLLVPTANDPAIAKPSGALKAEPFSEARLQQLQQQNRPVFVYFTADWCVTCKVNEKGVLEREDVAKSFQAKQVAVLVGDWTRGDPAIGRFLERHGRTGVPLYLYYAPGKAPEILPQVLTTARLVSLG
jgi:thiol:disulfide interchange protein